MLKKKLVINVLLMIGVMFILGVLGVNLVLADVAGWEEHLIDGDFDGAYSVYAADVDSDGDMDVIGAASEGDEITWLENDGSLNFAEHTIDANFDGARSVYVADVDQDGWYDVLGMAYNADDITWWENLNAAGVTSCDAYGNEKNQFAPGQGVYVKASGEANTNYKIRIQDDPVSEGDTLVEGENPDTALTQKSVTTDSSGNLAVTLIWSIPSDAPITHHNYDIVFDNQQAGTVGTYDAADDGIDSTTVAGMVAPIPELPTIILFSFGLLVLAGYVVLSRKKR